MEIGLIFFKEIALWIPLKNQLKSFQRKHLLPRKKNVKEIIPSESKPDLHCAKVYISLALLVSLPMV